MTATEVANAELDTLSITITGDTTYTDGEEFEVKIVDVNNTVNGKEIPINYTATYTANTNETIGSSSDNYFNARNSKDENIYKLYSTGNVKNNNQILVGFIKNDEDGISGTLNIKAYLDKDRIAISDTFPAESEPGYLLNSNMTQGEIDDCVDYLYDYFDIENYPLPEG